MKLTHEAFRGFFPHFAASLANLKPDLDSEFTIQTFAKQFRTFHVLHMEHSRHEDLVVFKHLASLFPGHTTPWNKEHEHDHESLDRFEELLKQLEASKDERERARIVSELQADIPPFVEHMKAHLKGEVGGGKGQRGREPRCSGERVNAGGYALVTKRPTHPRVPYHSILRRRTT